MDDLTRELYIQPPPHRPLTEPEDAVLRLIAEGLTYEEIGRARYLGVDTVKYHAVRAYRKLGARNAAHAVHIAHQRGILGAASTTPSTPVHGGEP